MSTKMKEDDKFSNDVILEIVVTAFVAFTMVFIFIKVMFF